LEFGELDNTTSVIDNGCDLADATDHRILAETSGQCV
jgi:hypothetical protein